MDLLANLELAVKAIIDAGALGVATFIGQDSHNQVRPSITIYAERGDELFIGSGNYRASVTVQVRSNASDTSEEMHRQRVGNVFDLVRVDDLASTLSGNSDVYVFSGGDSASASGIISAQEGHGREDNSWLSEFHFEVACCLRDIA